MEPNEVKNPHKKEIDERFFKIKTIYKTKYVDLPNGESLGYREAGEDKAPVLLLIHGMWQSSVSWEEIMGEF